MIHYTRFDSPFGTMLILTSTAGVCRICLPHENKKSLFKWLNKFYPEDELKEDSSALSNEVFQMKQYFRGKLRLFTLPLDIKTTPFREKALLAVAKIPYGKTASYKEIAESIHSPKAVRAVGSANANNPLPIVIPCHRVISHNGTLGGYGGGLLMKMKLLELEGIIQTRL